MTDNTTILFGHIKGPGIHDSVIQVIHFINNDRLDVCLRNQHANDRWIHLIEVARVSFKDVVNGSIVSDIFWWRLNNDTPIQGSIVDAWRILLGNNVFERDIRATIATLTTKYKSLLLVLFETSYGGQIASICRDVKTDLGQ